MGLFWISKHRPRRMRRRRLNPRFDGAFLNSALLRNMTTVMSLNPRFDGAFLNSTTGRCCGGVQWVLIPDLMGLFWIQKHRSCCYRYCCLNPRFDGAFLNLPKSLKTIPSVMVLIPDLMGLFWIAITGCNNEEALCLNPRFDGAFLNWRDKTHCPFGHTS